MKTIVLVMAGLLLASGVASAQSETDDARFQEAQRRLAERIKAAEAAKAAAGTQPAATKPAAPAKKSDRVLFIIDASGSMLGTYPKAAAELVNGVSALQEGQTFTIIATTEKAPQILSERYLPASEKSTAAAAQFLATIKPQGTDAAVLTAMPAIAKLKPDVAWFITDGDMQEHGAVAAAFIAACKGFRVNASTAFLNNQDPNSDEVMLLRKIATATGGVCIDREGKRFDPISDKPAGPPQPVKPATGPSIFRE